MSLHGYFSVLTQAPRCIYRLYLVLSLLTMAPKLSKLSFTTQEPKKKARRLAYTPTIDPETFKLLVQRAQSQKVKAEWYTNGTILTNLADEHMMTFDSMLPSDRATQFGNLQGVIPWASLMSGSEGDHPVMMEVERVINIRNIRLGLRPVTFIQMFACELDKEKRKWIDFVVNDPRRAHGLVVICIFCNIKDLDGTHAWCHVHEKKCRVPSVVIVTVSTSCKDLSNLSRCNPSLSKANQSKQNVPVLSKETSQGGSADTWRFCLNYVDNSPDIQILVYENSDNMVDEGKESKKEVQNWDIYCAEMANRGFETQCFLLNAKMFGVPENRRRFFAVNIKVSSTTNTSILALGNRSLAEVMTTLRKLVEACQRTTPPSVADVLYNANDIRVQREYLTRISNGHPKVDATRNWVLEHQKVYAQMRVSWPQAPPHNPTYTSPWYETLLDSHKSILVKHQFSMMQSHLKTFHDRFDAAAPGSSAQTTPMKHLMVDLAPSIGRFQPSTFHNGIEIAPCIVPNQLLWAHIDPPRAVIGQEAMVIQGWPLGHLELPEWVNDHTLQSLAGNAVSPPVMLALMLSTLASCSFTPDPLQGVDEDNEDNPDDGDAAAELANLGF